jgi:hypothetical protein
MIYRHPKTGVCVEVRPDRVRTTAGGVKGYGRLFSYMVENDRQVWTPVQEIAVLVNHGWKLCPATNGKEIL